MTGEKWLIDDGALAEFLFREFQVELDVRDCRQVELARQSIVLYESIEDFFRNTDWLHDNPELATEEYVTSNRICRWAGGKLVYFSRLAWEEGV